MDKTPRSGTGWWGLFLLILFTPAGWGLEGARNIHDPSTIIKCEGTYYVFGTGHGLPFLTSPDGYTWARGGKVFEKIPEAVHAFVPENKGEDVWAPDIILLHGEYYLYYSISSWGKFVSAVGLVTNPTLDPKSPNYKWTDRGMVVHSSAGENLNAIDPGVIHAPDGTLWICYGSYHGNIELVELDPQTGLRSRADAKVYIIASQSEASEIIYHDGFYYLFVNHGSCCQGKNSTYNIRVGRSKTVTGPYLDRHGEDLAAGAGTLFAAAAGTQVGPGHFGLLREDGVEKFSCHYEADIAVGGRSILEIRPLLWTLDGWPLPGENVRAGKYQIRSAQTGTVLARTPEPSTQPVLTTRYNLLLNQQWTILAAAGGEYKIANAADQSVLTAEPANNRGVGSLTTGPDAVDEAQLWKIDQTSDGTYRIASKASGLTLTALVKASPGNWVGLEHYTGNDAQRWAIVAP